MKTFYKSVDKNNREDMIDFLTKHFRYNTLNSWNQMTSYANDLKITHLELPSEVVNRIFDAMDCENAYDEINNCIDEWNETHDDYHVGFNGRSGGYLVLYNAETKPSEFKSYCPLCGQRNYKSVKDSGCRCGRCGAESRVDYTMQPMTKSISYASIDQDEDFEDWADMSLKERVEIVEDFDQLCDSIVHLAIELATDNAIVEETVMIPKKVRRLKPLDDK